MKYKLLLEANTLFASFAVECYPTLLSKRLSIALKTEEGICLSLGSSKQPTAVLVDCAALGKMLRLFRCFSYQDWNVFGSFRCTIFSLPSNPSPNTPIVRIIGQSVPTNHEQSRENSKNSLNRFAKFRVKERKFSTIANVRNISCTCIFRLFYLRNPLSNIAPFDDRSNDRPTATDGFAIP